MGSQELPGDVEHRYDLRRALFCSRFFEHRVSRWDRMMTYTAPLVVGGMMVGVFALMIVYAPVEAEVGPQTSRSGITVAQVDTAVVKQVVPLRVEDFLSHPDEPTVALAGFETHQTSDTRVIPLSTEFYVRTQ